MTTQAQVDARRDAHDRYAGELWTATAALFDELRAIGDQSSIPRLDPWTQLDRRQQRDFAKSTHEGRSDLLAAALTIGGTA